MPPVIEPAELARLIDFAERPRAHDWSLRAALVRYAQPRPQPVSDLLDLVRRTQAELSKNAAVLERGGPALWDALAGTTEDPDAHVIGVLRAAQALDALGDTLASWAVDREGARPDAEVDRVVTDVSRRLDALGVPQQERPPGPRNRG